jgi:hypothetical protein
MQITNEQMDAAILRFRGFPSEEDYCRALQEEPDFRAALEAAYARDPSFFTVDEGGWRPNQFNVDVPPAKPNENDPFGPGANLLKIRKYQRRSGDPFPTY